MSTEFQLHVQALRYKDEDDRAHCLCGGGEDTSETYSHIIAMQYDKAIVKENMKVSQEHNSCSGRLNENCKELGKKNFVFHLLNYSSHYTTLALCSFYHSKDKKTVL